MFVMSSITQITTGREPSVAQVLITTSDNLDALRFYQRGFAPTGLREGALDASRRMRPQIPLVGTYGIPIRDERVLVRELP